MNQFAAQNNFLRIATSMMVLLFLLPVRLSGQENPKNFYHFFRGGYQAGSILKTNDFLKGKNLNNRPIDWYQSARIEFGWETTGAEMWHAIWNYPAFGLGFYRVDYFDDIDQLGEPLALYGFASWPVKRWQRLVFNLNLGFGVSFNWKPFDPATNPYNIAIGDFQAAYIDVGITFDYDLSKHFSVIGGLTGTHFSNGGTKRPNLGLNQVGLMAMLKYKFEREHLALAQWEIPKYQKNFEWLISGSYGIRSDITEFEDSTLTNANLRREFVVLTLTSSFYRQISYKSKIGGGVDLVYDKSDPGKDEIDAAEGKFPVDLPVKEEVRVGLYGAYEFVLYRLSVLLNIGYTVIQKEDQLPRLYQRLGAKYHIFNNIFAGLNVRFQNFSKANHLEWNVGYRLQW